MESNMRRIGKSLRLKNGQLSDKEAARSRRRQKKGATKKGNRF
jgi:hypothetical protein